MTEYKGYQIKIIQDECYASPREDDNLGTMICFHKRSNFGSKFEVELSRGIKQNDFTDWSDVEKHIISKFDVSVILPIYMYEHGSIALSTIPFNDRWDSGQIGYIFISKEKVKKEYSCKRISKQLKERISGYLKSEIETYNLYLNGDIFFYRIEDKEGKEIDSLGGIYGGQEAIDLAKEFIDNIPSNAQDFIEKKCLMLEVA